ncbi:MAG TPA: LysM domain-containing protein [Chloroflexota bacterium]|nr:LysM domain-containing protein [Chloroflexota bacterium]
MEEYFPAPDRRYPSPSAQRRNGEHWKARFGLGFVILLTLVSAAIMFRIAGLGVGTATSALRGQAGPADRPAAAATAPSASGQQPGSQPAAAAQAPAPPAGPVATAAAPAQGAGVPAAVQATAAAQPTAAQPSPTIRPNQREHTVQGGDTLFAIAQRYDTTVDAIVAANNLPSRSVILRVGQVLVIPGTG